MGIKKINIAIFVGSKLESGGGHQYEYMVLNILKKYHNDNSIELKFYALDVGFKKLFSDLDININIIKENIFQKKHRILAYLIYFFIRFSQK